LAVLPAPDPSSKERISELEDGGGRARPIRSVAYTYINSITVLLQSIF
jgi:hypothetical protein